jgi:hypothetical protein
MALLLLCPMVLSAQNGVTVGNLKVESGTVTFDVSWPNNPVPAPLLWSDTVWVFVDYNAGGTMKRLLLTGASASAGTVLPLNGNYQGAWVAGNARSAINFSTTVKLYYDSKTVVAGACAYASNYPPVAHYVGDDMVTFMGTPPYDLVLNPGSVTAQSGGTFYLPRNKELASFTDKTGAPGIKELPATPPLAASTQTWSFGTSTLTWSDRIIVPDCDRPVFKTDGSSEYCCSYQFSGELLKRYYYNGPYAVKYASIMCPEPWRVPTLGDFNHLIAMSPQPDLPNLWGKYGWIKDEAPPIITGVGLILSTNINVGYIYLIWSTDGVDWGNSAFSNFGLQVRCVK